MNQQLDLFDSPSVQVDATHWNIYEGDKLIGKFESDGRSYDFHSCIGPYFGGNGGIWDGFTLQGVLDHVVKALRHHYRNTKGYRGNSDDCID